MSTHTRKGRNKSRHRRRIMNILEHDGKGRVKCLFEDGTWAWRKAEPK